jgi:hypothetical protein
MRDSLSSEKEDSILVLRNELTDIVWVKGKKIRQMLRNGIMCWSGQCGENPRLIYPLARAEGGFNK